MALGVGNDFGVWEVCQAAVKKTLIMTNFSVETKTRYCCNQIRKLLLKNQAVMKISL